MAKTKFEIFEESLKKGDLDGVRNNFEKDFLENIIDDDSKRSVRPIHWACWHGHINIVEFLIDQKCNIESEENLNCRPIHFACRYGSVEMVKLLIDQKCSIESEDKNNWRPIHLACRYGSIETVKLLIGLKCNIESEDNWKWRPIHFACRYGSVEMVKLLINQKCNIECEDNWKWRPIHLACWYGTVEMVKLLIDQKCDIESEQNENWRPIHFACQYNSVEMVKLLFDQKCDIESEQNENWRPIHLACQYGSVETVKLLIDQKCNIESEQKEKWRPIHFACRYGSVEMVKLLIDKKYNIESETQNKSRPIHFACRYGSVEMVKSLIDQNCNLESEDKNKWRPIHHACHSGHFENLKLLFSQRCLIEVTNGDGQTPIEVARSKGHNEIVKWIERFIKNSELCDSISNNNLEAFMKHCTCDTSMILDITSETPWLEMAVDKKADKFIKFFIDQQIHPLDIDTIRNVVDEDIKQSLNYQLWEEVLLFKCIRDQNQKGFMLLCRPNVINGQQKIILCSFLEVAAEHGHFLFINEILKKSIFDSESWKRAKEIALEKGHGEIADSISIRQSLLECRQKADIRILHTAVCDNDLEMVEYILKDESLSDPNHNHEILGTALALAILLCNEKCLSVLEKFNVTCNTRNKYLQTPLHEAISNGMLKHCRYLIDRTKSIDEAGFMEQTALHCAVMRGCEELCDELLKKGADCMRYMEFIRHSTQKKDSLSLTNRENALTLCAKFNKTIYPCFLESLDANLANSCDDKGNSLIHLAATLLNTDLCKSLIAKGGSVNSLNKCGNSPLFELLSEMDKETFDKNEEKIIEMVNVFIESKCNINQLFRSNLTLFDIALQFDCERLLLALVPHLLLNQSWKIDEYFLRISLEKNFYRFCEVLLDSEPQGQFEQNINSDMINMALLNNQRNLLKSLFIHSSLIVKECMIEKVLYHFADLDDETSFQWLLDMEIKSLGYLENGETLLTGLLKEGKKKFYQKLVQSKKNIKKYIDLKNNKSQTPLQVSIETESMEMLHHLIFETEDLDNEDIEGRTALMQLFEKLSKNVDETRSIGFMNVIRTIIYEGGHIYHKTQNGIKVIDYCSQPVVRQEIENYFLKWEQKKVTVEKEVKPKIKIICEICMDREVDSVFDCGHIICTICSENFIKCPFCGFEPVRPKRIYLG